MTYKVGKNLCVVVLSILVLLLVNKIVALIMFIWCVIVLSILFPMTLKLNQFSKENATLQDIKAAAKMANIDDFIESLANKYDTLVGERGVKLSGGERQRIAIARAMLKNAPTPGSQ